MNPNKEPAPDSKLAKEIGLVGVELAQGEKPGTEANWDADRGFTPPPSLLEKVESIRYGGDKPHDGSDMDIPDPTEPSNSPDDEPA